MKDILPLLFVTPEDLPPKVIVSRVQEAVSGGVSAVVLRRKNGPARDFLDLGYLLRDSLGEEFPIIVNTRLDMALSIHAIGLHLPEDHIPMDVIRKKKPDNFLLGVSCHSLESVMKAQGEGADYVFFGPVFETPSKLAYGPPQGLKLLEQVVAEAKIPVVAIGGIHQGNIESVRKTGASGVAMIGDLAYSADPKAKAFSLRGGWTRGWSS
ncbi:MAG: thiamine phosphate synthase [Leptospirillum sp.]